MVEHRVHVARRNREAESRPAERAPRFAGVPVGLAEDRHSVAFAFQEAAEQSHGETGVINIGIAGHEDHVNAVPSSVRDRFGGHRQELGRGGLGRICQRRHRRQANNDDGRGTRRRMATDGLYTVKPQKAMAPIGLTSGAVIQSGGAEPCCFSRCEAHNARDRSLRSGTHAVGWAGHDAFLRIAGIRMRASSSGVGSIPACFLPVRGDRRRLRILCATRPTMGLGSLQPDPPAIAVPASDSRRTQGRSLLSDCPVFYRPSWVLWLAQGTANLREDAMTHLSRRPSATRAGRADMENVPASSAHLARPAQGGGGLTLVCGARWPTSLPLDTTATCQLPCGEGASFDHRS